MVAEAVTRRAAGRMAVTFVWNPFWPVTNVLGSAWMGRESLLDDFVYLHADTVFTPSILDDCLAAGGAAALPIDFRPCEPEQMKATVTDGRVVHLSKELPAEQTAGEFIGIGVFRRPSLDGLRAAMDAELAAGGLTSYFEAAINRAVSDAGLEVVAVPTGGRPWTEIDFPEDLELARRILPDMRG
jgi:choline kinase